MLMRWSAFAFLAEFFDDSGRFSLVEVFETMRLNPRRESLDKKDLATYGTIITARKTIPSRT